MVCVQIAYNGVFEFERNGMSDVDKIELIDPNIPEKTPPASIASTEDIIAELKAGRMVVLVDEEDRENEGDLVLASDFVTPAAINFMVTHARGLVCLCLTEARCDELGLPIGNAVDFWTEASLFSQAGLTALVYGPGDIAQAHTADEFVTLDQLQRYAGTITRLLQNNLSGTTTP